MSFARRRFVNGESRAQTPSIFAAQTGGAFEDGGEGLIRQQLARLMRAIEDLN